MRKSTFAAVLSSAMMLAMLASCGGQASSSAPAAPTYIDATPNNPYGRISDFSAESGALKVGEELRFKVTPAEDFLVDKVTVNGKEANASEGGWYTWKMEEGQNRIEAKYVVDKTIDFVDRFKLNVPNSVFNNIKNKPKLYDFRRDGIEFMNMKGFFNCVDGDTTHFETMNYGYTVKVRYLGIDTPESTSEIEEWGKSASNYSKDLYTNRAKWVILQSQGWARGDEDKAATADGNQRSLAYVWYSEMEENPTKDSFKCVNLEMVYQGFSQGIGSKEDMGENYYYTFDKASKSAEINKRHQFSGEVDPNYDYTVDKGGEPRKLTLKELYAARDMKDDGKYITGDDNPYCDVKTLTKIEGYVSRVIGYAFYIQDAPSYARGEDGSLPEAYGIYVFTYSAHPISVGDYVSVVGVLSIYSGTYQLQGVTWKDFGANPNRDMQIISQGHEIKPIELTAAEFNAKKYDQVLVKVTDELYFTDKKSGPNSLSFGGINEVDPYNEKYPFYSSTNKIVFFGGAGSKTGTSVRLTQDQDVLLSYGVEKSVSYKFFLGGTNYYYPNHPEYIGLNDSAVANTKQGKYVHEVYHADGTTEVVTDTIDPNGLITTVYKAKKAVCAGISAMYVSSSGSLSTHCYQITIASPADITSMGEQ